MKIKEQIANFFTLMNLASGVMAIIFILTWNFNAACVCVFVGAFFDFFDGFIARALGITSEMGKQLDSLSDVVTFGVVPGLIAFEFLAFAYVLESYPGEKGTHFRAGYGLSTALQMIAVLIPVFSALRLAKFNIDTTQTKNFRGLPTPANGLLWASLGITVGHWGNFGLLHSYSSSYYLFLSNILIEGRFLIPLIIIMSLILVAPVNLMGMKFDTFTWRGNEVKFSFIGIAIILLVLLGFTAMPIILFLYILFSIIHFYILKRHEIQS